jgi:hypothetical protein
MAMEEPPEVTAPDDISALFMFLRDKLDPDEMATVEQLVENILDAVDNDPDLGEDNRQRFRRLGARKSVGDSKMVDRATIREWNEIREAEQETGVVMGLDSAPAVYREAIRRMGRDPAGLTGNAARATYRALRSAPHARARVAMDGRAVASRAEQFPHGDRLLKSFY